VLTYDGTKWINKAVSGTGTVTSVDMSVPTGLQVSGNPIVAAGTLAVSFANGYSIPTNTKQTNWDAAYNDKINSADVSGTTTKTLTLTQQDGGTITASWTDINTNLVTSVNTYIGDVVLTTTDIAEGLKLYYTEERVSANVDVAANTAARHAAVTIGTANGLSLSSQALSLALASASTTGALSSTDWSTFNNKVPYSGATGDVNLGEHQLLAGQITFDQSPTGAAGVGIMRWNNTDGTLDLGLKGGNVTLQVGQEIVARVVNKTGADLLESGYKVVRISSAQGQRLAVQLAQGNNDNNSTDTIGIVTETIANNQEGFITILGQVKEINTTGSLQGETWTDGDVLYLSPTTAGNITNIKPIAPQHMVVVGYVEYAHSQHGKIYCKTQNGYELEELHDCYLPTYVNNGVLYRDVSTNLWKNASIPTVLGYTPANDASVVHLAGTETITGYKTFDAALELKYNVIPTPSIAGYIGIGSNGVGITIATKPVSTVYNNNLYFASASNNFTFPNASGTLALTSQLSSFISLTSLSATAPLAYNNTTGGFSISQAGVSGNGYLSSTDWNTFNNKQTAGDYITALTGEATASGPGSSSVTLSTSAVTGKILTGINITGGSITATDSILVALGKAQNQINGLLGGAIYQSTWNASTNSPTLTSGTGTKGYYYIVSVAGSTNLDGITDWKVGDWAIFNGTTWDKVDNTDAVSSVNGFTGAVSLTTANISEVTNLYYTEARVSANTNVAANTAARHAAVTLGTANGLSLSTQQLSLALASTTATGALSSADWSTFSAKQNALTLTTTGTSGAATLVGATLNIPNYAPDLSGYVTIATTQTISGNKTFTGAFIVDSGTLLKIGASNYGTGYVGLSAVSGGIGVNFPAGVSSSLLFNTSNDYNYTFPNATGTVALTSNLTNMVTGSGTTNYLPKFTGASAIGNSLVYDNGTNVGINTITPKGILHAYLGTITSGNAPASSGTTPINAMLNLTNNRGVGMYFGGSYSGNYGQWIQVSDVGNLGVYYPLFLNPNGGNLLLGTTTDAGYKLDVNGTGRFSGQVTVGSDLFLSLSTASIVFNSAANFNTQIYQTGGSLVLYTGANPRLTIASTGAATFSSSVTAGGKIFTSTSVNDNIIELINSDTTNGYGLYVRAGGTASGRYVARFKNGADSDVLTIASTGNATFSSSVTALASTTNGFIAQTTANSVHPYFRWVANNRSYWAAAIDSGTDATFKIGGGNTIGSSSFFTIDSGTNASTFTTSLAVTGAATFSSSVEIGQSATVRGYTGTTGAGMFMAYGSAGAGVGSIYSYNYGTSTYGGTIIDGSYVAFYNSGSEKMRITSGNVGIGTSSPYNKLTIEGSSARMDLNDGGGASRKALIIEPLGYGSNAYARIESYNYGTATGGALVINTTGGNVLIGTTTDSGYKLDVNGTGRFSSTVQAYSKVFIQRAAGGADTLIQFKNEVGTDKAYIKFGGTNEELSFYAGTGATENLKIASTGAATFSDKVGLGGLSTYTQFNIATGNDTQMALGTTSTSQTVGIFMADGPSTNTSNYKWEFGKGAANDFFIYSYSVGANVLSLALSNGAATFRSSVTAQSFDILKNGSSSFTSSFKLTSASGPVFSQNLQLGAGGSLDVYGWDGSSWIKSLSLSTIGQATLYNLAGTGSRAVLADANGLLSAPVSDISVKQNIKPIGYGLNEISKMNPVWFDFIDGYKNYGEGRQNGNIAQEMKAIIPEAVFITPSTGKMGINYDQLHAVYIKAIQELKAEIEILKNK
jgi:hypothetical protein